MVHSNRAKLFALFAILLFAAAGYAAPTAAAGANQVAAVGQNVTVSGASSACSGCTIVSYGWNWGDGNTSSGVSATHAYGTADGYTVTLTVVANDSSVSSDTLLVTVQSSDSQSPTITHTNVTDWTQNQSIPISATVTDNIGVSTVTLYYKNASAASYSSSTMSTSGSTYSGTIPNTSTSESNALYYISASDTASPSNTQSHGSSGSPVNISLSATDTIPPITTLTSVSGDTSSPYWVTQSNSTNNTVVLLSGESGMSCRMGQGNSNYTGMTTNYVDCVMSGSTANCTTQLADGNYTRFVACKDSSGNEQNTSQTLNVSFGVDSVAPTAISPVNATEGTTKISLSWTAPTDATSGVSVQKIFRSTGGCTNYSSIQSAYSATGASYNDTSASAGTTYCYYVVGQDTAGNVQGTYTATTAIKYGAPTISAISLTLSGSTLTLAATTNENASCRYSTSNLSYANMSSNFTTTGSTSHSTTGSGSSGTITYYVSCADTAGNNMTTANSTNYTFSSGTTSASTSGSNSGGGSVAGGSPSATSGEAETFALTPASGGATTVSVSRSVSFDSTENKSTFALKIENTGASATGAITIKEKIPERVANSTGELEFSQQPTRFESGSIIAVWDLAGGIGPGESLTLTYSVKKPVASLAGFEATVASLAPPAPATPPAQPPAQQPAQQPAPKPPAAPSQPPAQPAPAPTATPQQPSASPQLFGTLLSVGGIVVAIVLVGALAFFLLYKRKKRA